MRMAFCHRSGFPMPCSDLRSSDTSRHPPMKPREQQSGCRVPGVFLPKREDVPDRGSETQQGHKPWRRQDIGTSLFPLSIAVPSPSCWECRGVETGVPVLLS